MTLRKPDPVTPPFGGADGASANSRSRRPGRISARGGRRWVRGGRRSPWTSSSVRLAHPGLAASPAAATSWPGGRGRRRGLPPRNARAQPRRGRRAGPPVGQREPRPSVSRPGFASPASSSTSAARPLWARRCPTRRPRQTFRGEGPSLENRELEPGAATRGGPPLPHARGAAGGRAVRPQHRAGSVVNRCGSDWSAVADAPAAPG